MDLGSTQPLVKMSTRNIPGGIHVPNVMKSGSLNLLEPSKATPGLLLDSFTFTLDTRGPV